MLQLVGQGPAQLPALPHRQWFSPIKWDALKGERREHPYLYGCAREGLGCDFGI